MKHDMPVDCFEINDIKFEGSKLGLKLLSTKETYIKDPITLKNIGFIFSVRDTLVSERYL